MIKVTAEIGTRKFVLELDDLPSDVWEKVQEENREIAYHEMRIVEHICGQVWSGYVNRQIRERGDNDDCNKCNI